MNLRREFKGAFTVWYRDVLRFFGDPMRIVGSLAQPLLFLVILGTGFASALEGMAGLATDQQAPWDFRQFMLPGVIGMSVLFTSVFSAASIVWDREFGFLREVLVSPVSRIAVGLGKVAGGSTVALIQGAIILALAPIVGIELTLGAVALTLVLILFFAATMSSFGILLASRQKTMEGFQVIMQFLLLPMLFLSGAFFPLTTAPEWMQALATISPVTYGVDALRQSVLGASVPTAVLDLLRLHPLRVDVLVLLAFFVVFLLPGVWLFSKQE